MNNKIVYLTQLKLVTGEEIICEIVKRNYLKNEICIKSAMCLIKKVNEEGFPYYVFVPFMVHQCSKNSIVHLKRNAIISQSSPTKIMMETYKRYVFQEYQQSELREAMTDDIIEQIKNTVDKKNNDKYDLENYDFGNQKKN
jgi:hypothetical protein